MVRVPVVFVCDPVVRSTVLSTERVRLLPSCTAAPPAIPDPFVMVMLLADNLDIAMGPVILASVTAPVAICAPVIPSPLIVGGNFNCAVVYVYI